MNKRNICLVLNYAPHYRMSLFKSIDDNFNCEFYFGDKVNDNIKKIDYSNLSGFVKEVRLIKFNIKGFKWLKDVIFLPFKKKHDVFILTGDTGFLSNLVILLFCKILNKRTYLWMHGLYEKPTLKQKIIYYPHYWLTTGFFLYGNYAKELLINEGFSIKKMNVIYNSLASDEQLLIRENLVSSSIYKDYFGNSFPVLIYIGRIQTLKKIDLIIRAMGELKIKKLELNLVVVGGNNDNISFEEEIKKYGLESNIWFYGASYNEVTNAELIYNADLCVSPGNIGLTAIHAFAYGTPCITHGNFKMQMPEFEIIDEGVTGSFFKEDDLNDLVSILEKWFLSGLDRKKIRLACYEKVDKFYNTNYQVELIKNVIYENNMDC